MKQEEREALRRKVRYFYDLQKVRIQLGNRTDDPALYVIKKDAHTGKEKRTKKKATRAMMDQALVDLVGSLKKDPDAAPESSERPAEIILDEEDRLFLRRQNLLLESLEADTLEQIAAAIKRFPIFGEFLQGVKGCGPTMSAVILSEVQMAYEVPPETLSGDDVLRTTDITVTDDQGKDWQYTHAVHKVMVENTDPESKKVVAQPVEVTRKYFRKGEKLYHDVCPTVSSLWSYSGLAVDTSTGKARRRAKGVRFNWNPFLKTKVLGVLASCMIKSGSPYREHYDNYKHRKEASGWGNSAAHRHNAAMRVMMKKFLQDLWVEWRRLEGFPTPKPYAEAMLGRVHGDHGGVR